MPKRKRLFTPLKRSRGVTTPNSKDKSRFKTGEYSPTNEDSEVSLARGRLKGALREVLEPSPPSEESSSSRESSPVKSERKLSEDRREVITDEEAIKRLRKSPPRQSYVLKLFDRSVDLSQFRDDSPLYPICRAWMANQPKAIYNEPETNSEASPGGVELPGPKGPPVPKVPDLLPEQLAANKDNIDLDYRSGPPRAQLLRGHMRRWAAVRHAWLVQMMLNEARYEGTQQVLNNINLEYPPR